MTGTEVLLKDAGAPAGVDIIGDFKSWNGGDGYFIVSGNLGLGTIELEATAWQNVIIKVSGTKVKHQIVSTVIGTQIRFHLPHGMKIRAVLSGSTSPSSEIKAEAW